MRDRYKRDANTEEGNFYGKMARCIKESIDGTKNMGEGL